MSWEIDAIHSHVSFAVRHLMVSTVRGRFNRMRGQIHIDESQPANSWVEAEVDVATVDTQNEQRDAHLRTADFFEVDTYPTITFKSTKVEAVSGQEYRVTGDFTMHGVTKSVTFDVEYGGQSHMGGAGPRAGARSGGHAREPIVEHDDVALHNAGAKGDLPARLPHLRADRFARKDGG